MIQERIAITHPTCTFNFALADLQATQTGTVIPILGGAVNTYRMPLSGYIVGYSIQKSADHTAGTLAFDLLVAGSSVLTISAPTVPVYSLLNEPSYPFAVGDTLGVTYTSNGSLAATTVDVVVTVFVVFNEFNF